MRPYQRLGCAERGSGFRGPGAWTRQPQKPDSPSPEGHREQALDRYLYITARLTSRLNARTDARARRVDSTSVECVFSITPLPHPLRCQPRLPIVHHLRPPAAATRKAGIYGPVT